MAKETVRFPDDLVAQIKEAVDGSELFESRSEFHRVSSELLLDLLDPDHEPTNFSYRELRAEMEDELGVDIAAAPPFEAAAGPGEEAPDFLEAYVSVRRRAMHGDVEGAREVVSERYALTAPEAILLDEVIAQHRPDGVTAGAGAAPGSDPAPETAGAAGAGTGPEADADPDPGPSTEEPPEDPADPPESRAGTDGGEPRRRPRR